MSVVHRFLLELFAKTAPPPKKKNLLGVFNLLEFKFIRMNFIYPPVGNFEAHIVVPARYKCAFWDISTNFFENINRNTESIPFCRILLPVSN